MANFLAAAHQNAQDIISLSQRVKQLERTIADYSGGRGKYVRTCDNGAYSSPVDDPQGRVNHLVKKGNEMRKERMAIMSFNEANAQRNPDEILRWTDTKILKGGKERTITFTRADDRLSLTSLIASEHRETLCMSGPTPVNITRNIFKKYWVVIIDNELVTLCRDFKGGIGGEYFWSSDEEMEVMPPSSDWKNASKKEHDPRREYIDPQTMELWVPDDEKIDHDSKGGIVSDDGKGEVGQGSKKGDGEVDEQEVGGDINGTCDTSSDSDDGGDMSDVGGDLGVENDQNKKMRTEY